MTMRVVCHLNPGRIQKSLFWMQAFAKGCGGDLVSDGHARDCINVVLGQQDEAKQVMEECHLGGIPFIQIDNGYFRADRGSLQRTTYMRATWNALVSNTVLNRPADRWERLGVDLWPWRPEGLDVVLAAPGAGYAAYLGFNPDAWANETMYSLLNQTERPVILRTKGSREPLLETLLGAPPAHCLVTHCSNAGVESIVFGVPVICDPGAAAAPVARTSLAEIENLVMPDRMPWLSSLAYQQWTVDEFADGTAWRHLQSQA